MPKPTPKVKRRSEAFLELPWVAPAAVALFTALLWARSLAVPLHEWDDSVYLFRDARLEHLTWENIRRILTQPFYANFHPVTTLTYAFDRAVWGTSIAGFHVTQLFFYVGGVLGLYFLFARLLGSRPAALAAASLYAANAIHVESVAWLASRKDVVCLFFYAPALLAYIRYAEGGGGRGRGVPLPYALSWILAAAAMLSKGYAVILPAAFLAYDFCFTGRITRRNLIDKIPFAILSAGVVYLTLHAQDRDSALLQSTMDVSRRAALLAKVFALYVGKALLPVGLSAFYTIAADTSGATPLLGAFLAVALLVGFFRIRARAPAAAFGIALYLLPLATVMNVFFRLRIWIADRYLFLPTVGSSLALVSLALLLFRLEPGPNRGGRRGPLRRAAAALALTAIALYSALTNSRIDVWASRVRLWSDTVRKEVHLGGVGPVTAEELGRVANLRAAASTPIVALARAYEMTGNAAEGARITALLSGGPGQGGVESEMTLAQQDLKDGRPAEAVRRLQPIASGGSWLAPIATMWIGVAEGRLGHADAGRQTILRGVDLYRKTGQPATDGLLSVGGMEFNSGNYAEAGTWYALAARESPRDGTPAFYVARCLEEQRKFDEAMALYRRIAGGELPILAGTPLTLYDVYVQMGSIEQKRGHPKEAIAFAEEALRRTPDASKQAEVRKWIEGLRALAR